MKKIVLGLVGLVLCCCAGCDSELSFNQEVSRLRKYDQKIKNIYKFGKGRAKINDYDNKIRKILDLKDSDNYHLIRNPNGEVFGAMITGKGGKVLMHYIDTNKDDGKEIYDKRVILGIPDKLDILKIFPAPEKKNNKKPGILM